MKKRNLIKLFALTLCFITILSTVVFAKENKNTQFNNISVCKSDPHPGSIELPEDSVSK